MKKVFCDLCEEEIKSSEESYALLLPLPTIQYARGGLGNVKVCSVLRNILRDAHFHKQCWDFMAAHIFVHSEEVE